MTRDWRKPYNGFTWAQRCAVTPLQNAALRDGRLIRPTMCCICGDDRAAFPQGRDYRFLHLEDYRTPLAIYPLCKSHHAALHARFDDPDRWQRVIRAHSRPGEWFMMLSLDPTSQEAPYDQTYPQGLPPPSLPVLSPWPRSLPLQPTTGVNAPNELDRDDGHIERMDPGTPG